VKIHITIGERRFDALPTFPGIDILGRLDDDALQRICELDGPVTATVSAAP